MTITGNLTSKLLGRQVVVTEPPPSDHPDWPNRVFTGLLVSVMHELDDSWLTGQETGPRVTWVVLRSGLPVDGIPAWKNDRPIKLAASVPVEVI